MTPTAQPHRFPFRSWDGTTLAAAVWEPQRQPWGPPVVLVHGMGEHLGRYQGFGQDLATRGYRVWGLDLRGHGRSPGKRGDALGLHYWVHDLIYFWEFTAGHLVNPVGEATRPPAVVAHSMGGLLALAAAFASPNALGNLFLISPYFRPAFAPQWWRLAAARSLAKLCPSLTLDVGLRPEQLAHDREVQIAIERDPDCHQKLSARIAVQLLAKGETLLNSTQVLPVPCQIVHGDGDTVNCHAASQQFADHQPNVTLTSLPGGAHQIHNDAASRPQVWNALMHFWLRQADLRHRESERWEL
jgi:acylglycerol lipase